MSSLYCPLMVACGLTTEWKYSRLSPALKKWAMNGCQGQSGNAMTAARKRKTHAAFLPHSRNIYDWLTYAWVSRSLQGISQLLAWREFEGFFPPSWQFTRVQSVLLKQSAHGQWMKCNDAKRQMTRCYQLEDITAQTGANGVNLLVHPSGTVWEEVW